MPVPKALMSAVTLAGALALAGCGGGGGGGNPPNAGAEEARKEAERLYAALTTEGVIDHRGGPAALAEFSGATGERDHGGIEVTGGADATYGWWVATGADGDITRVTAFYNLGGLANDDYTGALAGTGSATYEGDATGRYAVPDGAGNFTATAALTAGFGAAPTLSGTIGNFRDADGGDLGWSVALEGTGLAYRPGEFDVRGGETVWTLGGKAGAAGGEWRADLYGGGGNGVPTHALGTFEAGGHRGGYMVGAFGARMEPVEAAR